MSIKKIFSVVLITMGTMWVANQAAALSPTARKLLKGNSVSAVSTSGVASVTTRSA